MAKTKIKSINKFFGGIVRDDKSRVPGGAYNIEELDIFSNEDYIQPEQIFSDDTLPASTELYAITADNDDTVWGYGKQTSNNAVRLLKVTTGGVSNPGAWATQFTSADTTDIAYLPSPIQYFRRDDGNQDFLYYLTNASGTVKLKSYDITGDSESETDSGSDAMTLTGLNGSYDRLFLKVGFGELYAGNGQYIAKVDKDGVFTEKAFTLPNGWEAVDIVFVSDVAIILARSTNRLVNYCKGFWWDLTNEVQIDDSFDVPFGGPQWIQNHKETIKIMCAQNGKAKFYQLSGAFPGAVPIELPGLGLLNVSSDTSTQPISAPKSVATKDNILYFFVNKTDKTGMYAIGQLDSDKPWALILSKRLDTTDYSNHVGIALWTQGPNFYGAFSDDGTNGAIRCESENSPTRSSNAVYESIIIDDGNPFVDKQFEKAYITTYPMSASTDIDMSIATDYGSYTEIFRADGTSFNNQNGVLGMFEPKSANLKVLRIKLEFTSNTTNAPKLTGIAVKITVQDNPGNK